MFKMGSSGRYNESLDDGLHPIKILAHQGLRAGPLVNQSKSIDKAFKLR